MLRVLTLAFIIVSFGIRTLHKAQPTQAATNNTYSNVIINELMANPIGSDSLYEWIELYNTTNETIELSEWKIQGKTFSANIEPYGYLIIARDAVSLEIEYQELNIIEASISLKNGGDTIELVNDEDLIVDSFAYENSQEGKSIERIGIPDFADDCELLETHESSHTIGTSNLNEKEICFPYIEQEEESVEISNIQFSFDGVDYYDSINSYGSTELFIDFEINIGLDQIYSYKILDDLGRELTIPIVLNDYYGRDIAIEVELLNGQIVRGYSNPINIYPILEFTEVYSGDTNWVEIYNPNEFKVDISSYHLNINGDQFYLNKSNCPISLMAQSYCLVDISQHSFPANIEFKVADMAMLSLSVEEIENDTSISLYLDNWVSNLIPTPGKANKPSDIDVIINEVYPSPNTGEEEWLELFNQSSYRINIEGWYLTEGILGEECKPNSSFNNMRINPGEYLVIGQSDLKVSLNNSGDEIYLCNSQNEIISKIEYPEVAKGISYSRLVDNYSKPMDEFTVASKPTPGLSNEFPVGNSIEGVDEGTDPVDINSVSNIATLDGKVIYAEGIIIGNYGSSFDIQTPKGVLRVGFSNIDKPEREKGDMVKVTGVLEIDGDTFRVFPQHNDDLEIIHVEEEILSKSTKVSTVSKSSTISSASKGSQIGGVSTFPILPADLFDIKEGDSSILPTIDSSELSGFILIMAIAAIILVLYVIYITELDQKAINYIKLKNEEKITYFKTNINRQKISRRPASSGFR